MKNWRMLIFVLSLYANSTFAVVLQVMDKIAAVVNNSVVLESDINKLLNLVKQNTHDTSHPIDNIDNVVLRRQILDWLIMDNIILQLAQRANITINDSQLDQAISNIASRKHMTLNQLRNCLFCDGIDYDTYRAQIRKEMIIAKIQNGAVRLRITILPQEVESLVKHIAAQTSDDAEFNLSYILIPLSENQTQDQVNRAEALANSLVKQSKNGANFVKLAITCSSDNTQVLRSGQIGWSNPVKLPTFFAERLRSVHKGSIIGPIRSNAGFYILKVNDIRGGNQKFMVTEVHAGHILLKTSVIMTDQQAHTKLLDIAQQIKNGHTSFDAAAKQISEDLSSANQGGDLGWISARSFDPILHDTLMHLKKGEISAPVRSFHGWHLIQLINVRQIDRTEAAQKDQAYHLLFKHKFNEEMQIWMQEQRASTYVKIFNNNDHNQ